MYILGIQRAHRVAFGRSSRAKKSKRQSIFLAAQTGRSHWPHAVPTPAPPAPRASESTAPGRRAGLPNELHPKFELAESTAVPKISKIRLKFELTSQSVVIKKARPKL